ncbi:hypothetical protein R3P38DRAFT_277909 [Favolaschia claudopus]|uniref:C2H2-type domain-containing protein n=1 Tax=Favolaschia claudopus TaxID=2862362 RepID=A0AAV9ZPN3_9AGAR
MYKCKLVCRDKRGFYFCGFVGKLATVKRHILGGVHFDYRRFICGLCRTRFSQRGAAEGHLNRHTGQKPYICPEYQVCGQQFSDKSGLHRHRAGKHEYVPGKTRRKQLPGRRNSSREPDQADELSSEQADE